MSRRQREGAQQCPAIFSARPSHAPRRIFRTFQPASQSASQPHAVPTLQHRSREPASASCMHQPPSSLKPPFPRPSERSRPRRTASQREKTHPDRSHPTLCPAHILVVAEIDLVFGGDALVVDKGAVIVGDGRDSLVLVVARRCGKGEGRGRQTGGGGGRLPPLTFASRRPPNDALADHNQLHATRTRRRDFVGGSFRLAGLVVAVAKVDGDFLLLGLQL